MRLGRLNLEVIHRVVQDIDETQMQHASQVQGQQNDQQRTEGELTDESTTTQGHGCCCSWF